MHEADFKVLGNGLVYSSSLLFIPRIGNTDDEDVKPPRPKRVSSARFDTVNPTESSLLGTSGLLVEDNAGFKEEHVEPSLRATSASSIMGSGSSMQHGPPMQGKYTLRSDYSSSCHVRVPSGSFHRPLGGSNEQPNFVEQPPDRSFEEYGRIKKAAPKELRFKQSTFKGGSMSALTMPRDSFQKSPERKSYTNLTSIFPQTGKYKFGNYDSVDRHFFNKQHISTDIFKPKTLLNDSKKLTETSPDPLSLDVEKKSPVMPDNFGYDVSPSSSTGGSSGIVSDLFHKSKSRVRNSLRNLRFYSRNLSSEKKISELPKSSQRDHLPQSNDLYDPILTYRDDNLPESSWLDDISPHASGPLASQKPAPQTTKAVVAVETPTLSTSTRNTTGPDHLHNTRNNLSSIQSTVAQGVESITPEQESIKVLDNVIANLSQNITGMGGLPMQPFETRTRPSEDLQSKNLHKSDKPHASKSPEISHNATASVGKTEPHDSVMRMAGKREKISSLVQHPVNMSSNNPVVIKGMSVSDVLRENEGSEVMANSKAWSSSASSLPQMASFHSESINSDIDSFDGSFVSAGSHEIPETTGQGDHQMLVGAGHIRKTGWLVTKHVLTAKRGRIEQAAKRNWQKYWVEIKGGYLLFYDLEGKSNGENNPKLVLSIDGALVLPVPEHVKKDNVMCMSVNLGSVYLLQAGSQTEVDGWVKAIHTEAAIYFAAKQEEAPITKNAIERLLHHDIECRKREIDMDEKMKKMADLQMGLVPDVKSRKAITDQIIKWEEGLEKNQLHVFRFRCYLSSLNDTELPNSRNAMAAVCKSSKQLLGTIKLFNISSLHALVIAREQNMSNVGATKPSTLRLKSLTSNIKRSGSFNESVNEDFSMAKSVAAANKSKKSNIFASLRGFETWRGGAASTGKKKNQRPSVSGILSAFTAGSSSSQSSTKETEENVSNQKSWDARKTPPGVKKQYSSSVFYQTLQPPDNDAILLNSVDLLPTSGNISDDDMVNGLQHSNAGSLDSLLLAPPDAWCAPIDWSSSTVRVALSETEFVTVTTTENMTFRQLLEIVCQRKQLDSGDHYLVLSKECPENRNKIASDSDDRCIPDDGDLLSAVDRGNLRLMKKRMYSIELERKAGRYGFTVLPKAICHPLIVENVTRRGCSLHSKDEILTMNGDLTSEMNDSDVARQLGKDTLRLLVRTCYYQADSKSKIWWIAGDNNRRKSQGNISDQTVSEEDKKRNRSEELMYVMEEYLQKIVIPPPPIVTKLQPSFIRSPFTSPMKSNYRSRHGSAEDIISLLVVPRPLTPMLEDDETESFVQSIDGSRGEMNEQVMDQNNSDKVIDELLKKAETVTSMCRQIHIMGGCAIPPPLPFGLEPENQLKTSDGVEGMDTDSPHQLSGFEKIQKVLFELIDTETAYVKDLECLLKRYLEPLHNEGFFTCSEMGSLLNNVEGMLLFQKTFLLELSQTFIRDQFESEISSLNRRLLSVASTFLQHAAQFKLYAVFSTCHTVAQDLMEREKQTSVEFRKFLDARNPKRQHSSTIESYLIKPIQRVLKYPLLLRELLSLSDCLDAVSSKARRRLKAALQAMNEVARHINDSQTVHDEFGGEGFNEIMKQAVSKANIESDSQPSLCISDLLCYCSSDWLNVFDEVGKLKKGNVMEMLVLVFRTAVVLLCRGIKQREKRKATTPQRDATHLRASVSDFVYFDVIPRSELFVEDEKHSNVCELVREIKPGSRRFFKLSWESVEAKERVVNTVKYVIKGCLGMTGCSKKEAEEATDETDNPNQEDPEDVSTLSEPEQTLDISSMNLGESIFTKKQRAFFYKPEDSGRSLIPTINIDTKNPNEAKLPQYGLNILPMKANLSTFTASRNSFQRSFERGSTGNLSPKNLAVYDRAVNRSSSFQSIKNDHLRPKDLLASAPASPARSLRDSEQLDTQTGMSSLNNNILKSPDCNHDVVRKYRNGSPTRYNMVYGISPYESKI